MPDGALSPFLALVWQPQDLNRTVMDMSRGTATTAIFDLSRHHPEEWTAALKSAGAGHVKISSEALLDPGLETFIQEAGVDTLWVEFHPAIFPGDAALFLSRLRKFENLCRIVPISGDLDFLLHLVRSEHPPEALALKGSEASGLVSTETLGILFAALEQELAAASRPSRLIVWGGVGTPEAAAAFLASALLWALPMLVLAVIAAAKESDSTLICLLPFVLLPPFVALWRWGQLRRYRRRRRRFIEEYASLLTEEWQLWARIQQIEAARAPNR